MPSLMLRMLTCAFALAAMAGQIGGYAHLAFTRHITCAEHGELVEAAGGGGSFDGARETRFGGAVAAHGHDHCALAPQRRDRAHASTPHRLVVKLPELVVAQTASPVDPPRPLELLLLAPKSSPPA